MGNVTQEPRRRSLHSLSLIAGTALVVMVLIDVEMPVLDGPGMAARMLLEDAGKERVPNVIMSGAQNLARIASRVGTPYFLPKPSALHDILLMLQRALAERRAPAPLLW